MALKLAVDRWSQAEDGARALAFEGALAVRHIEIGLASLFSVIFSLAVLAFGVSICFSRRFASWLGWVGVVGGTATLAAGVMQATTGFSPAAMFVSMSGSLLLLVWAIALGVVMWRLAPAL